MITKLLDGLKNAEIKITEGVFLAYLTLMGYLSAFIYKLNFMGFYGIPSTLIYVDIQDILITIILIVITLIPIIFLVDILISRSKLININFQNSTVRKLTIYFVIAVMAIIYILLKGPYPWIIAISCLVTIFSSIIETLVPSKTFKESEPQHSSYVFNLLSSYNFRFITTLLVLTMYILLASTFLGKYSAKNKEVFLIYSKDDLDYVLFNLDKEHYIAIEIDRNQNKIKNNMILIPDTSNLNFKRATIGKLLPL